VIIDCDTCRVRGPACGDCVVTVMLGLPGTRPSLDVAEQRAIGVLAASGLVPPLRLVPGADDDRPAPRSGTDAYDHPGDDGTARAG
jgi:hypothetical protein